MFYCATLNIYEKKKLIDSYEGLAKKSPTHVKQDLMDLLGGQFGIKPLNLSSTNRVL